MINSNLNNIFEEIENSTLSLDNQCPNCGAALQTDFSTKCNVCGYDFAQEFICPYKIIKDIKLPDKTIQMGFCELTKKQCRVESLDYEICSTFRSLDSLKEKD